MDGTKSKKFYYYDVRTSDGIKTAGKQFFLHAIQDPARISPVQEATYIPPPKCKIHDGIPPTDTQGVPTGDAN